MVLAEGWTAVRVSLPALTHRLPCGVGQSGRRTAGTREAGGGAARAPCLGLPGRQQALGWLWPRWFRPELLPQRALLDLAAEVASAPRSPGCG